MNKQNIISSILLISCTSIGGGILALPCATAINGFFVSSLIFIICWTFMTISSFFMLEVTLWFKKNINIITMVNQILGYKWKIFISIIYISLLYSLLSAYIFACNKWLEYLLNKYIEIKITKIICIIIFFTLNVKIIFYKKLLINKLNYILSLCFIYLYILLIFLYIPNINISSVTTCNINHFYKNISLIITSFGFCIVIPTIVTYLKKNLDDIRLSVLAGSIIPLIMYILWEFTILGLFPIDTESSIINLNTKEKNFDIMFIYYLKDILNLSFIYQIIILFAILAILTSIIGVSISLYDFTLDIINTKIQKKTSNIFLLIFVTLPPVIFCTYYATGFTKILELSGILVSILLGILPITMTWYGRYYLNIKSKFIVYGGKPLIITTYIFFILVITYEMLSFI